LFGRDGQLTDARQGFMQSFPLAQNDCQFDMKKLASFIPFLLVVMGCGIAIGTLTAPGEWYAQLQKPFFNPPNWIFGPVWTVLYLVIAYVGWRLWQQHRRVSLVRLWIIQMGLNFLWSPVFFSAQNPELGLIVIGLLFLTISLFIWIAWHSDRRSALLFVPYLAWVGFASVLNAAIVYFN
jgi:tryptophan-rich sensory protein